MGGRVTRGAARRPRLSYHHGNLRQALVDAATALLERDGPLGVTLRGAARAAGVSQTAPYRHFASKDTLLAAVAERGFVALRAAMVTAARAERADPVRALQAMALATIRFATAHPSHYRLMSGPAVRGRKHPSLRRAAADTWSTLTEAVTACRRAGRLPAGDPDAPAFALWCVMHGLATLVVDEQIPPPVLAARPLSELAEYATATLLLGLAADGNGKKRRRPVR